MRRVRGCSATAVSLLVAVGLLQAASADVIFVYSVQRHGAREFLPKSDVATEIHSVGGPTLLPAGERDCYKAGVAFRQRYFNMTSCVSTGTCMSYATTGGHYGLSSSSEPGSFHNGNVLARSSSLDRTLLSAEAFLLGVFPPEAALGPVAAIPTGEQLVPVYSVPDADDYLIRGYSKCPSYQDDLRAWFASAEFQSKEASTAAFRDSIGTRLAGRLSTDLPDFWNVYDQLSVWAQYGTGDPMPELDASEMAEAEAVAGWLEVGKMHPARGAGRRLGGAMVGDLAARLAGAADAVLSQRAASSVPRLATVSAHYPTMLAVLSALGPDVFGASPWGGSERIPALSSVLSFELHSDGTSPGTSFAVRLVGQDGPGGEVFTIPMPCARPDGFGGEGFCGLADFKALAASATVAGDSEWCGLCGNEALTPCRLQRLEALEAAAAEEDGSGSPPSPPPLEHFPEPCPIAAECGACAAVRDAAVAAVVSALLTLLVAVGVFVWFYQRQRRYWLGDKGAAGHRSAVVGNPAYGVQMGMTEAA